MQLTILSTKAEQDHLVGVYIYMSKVSVHNKPEVENVA